MEGTQEFLLPEDFLRNVCFAVFLDVGKHFVLVPSDWSDLTLDKAS